ncbi:MULTISPECIES: arylsulfatase [unclassified Microbacterium]|uniref:arylsulfatase n=1 Tax=unclassified Microbacterium TaxID=2609290 RepID=UPI0030197E22
MNRPNVVIVLADDLGYSDISPFGGEIDTPQLERLAARGVRMTSYYVTPRCSPSRAALLTGRHPHSVGIGVLTTDNRPRGYPGSLDPDVPTLAERVKDEGYATAVFGKWHLASDMTVPSATWPTRRGFDEFRGMLPGASSYRNPPITEGEQRVADADLPEDYYFTEDITQSGVDFIRRRAEAEEPFFLFLAYTAPHWPLQADESDIAKYRDRFGVGWARVQAERFARMRDLGVASGVERFEVGADLDGWPADARWETERMAVYAAQVESLDRGVGRILDALEVAGVDQDTIVLFFSDNGGCSEEITPGRTSFSELVCPPVTRAGEEVVVGNHPDLMPGPANTYQSYGERWATVSNTPFRMWKRWVHEGGISTPFIASWPAGGVPAGADIMPGVGHIIDIVPTVLDAMGLESDLEGESLLPVWRGEPTEERTLFWEHVGNAAVRRGRYKLVREWGGPWELYDIAVDRGESHDLSAAEPALAAELLAEYEAWAQRNGVIPWEDVLADHVSRGLAPERAMG